MVFKCFPGYRLYRLLYFTTSFMGSLSVSITRLLSTYFTLSLTFLIGSTHTLIFCLLASFTRLICVIFKHNNLFINNIIHPTRRVSAAFHHVRMSERLRGYLFLFALL